MLYSPILDIIALAPPLVIGTLFFLAFHIPVTVSNVITNIININRPYMGDKNVNNIAINLAQLDCMVLRRIISWFFME
jgi:hypothetical protein